MTKRAVLYCRVSTKDQVKNLSLETQRARCVDYCLQNGVDVDRVFVDEGESAKTSDRPAFMELLRYCRSNRDRVHFLVVHSLSRFARSSRDHAVIRSHLGSMGIRLRSATEPIDDSSSGKLMENVVAAFAQFDNDVRSERTIAGMKAALRKGRWPFPPPLGYQKASSQSLSRELTHDPARAPLIARAFQMFSTGRHSKAEVLREVTAMGLRTRRGTPVSAQTFHNMLKNPIYGGRLVVDSWGVSTSAAFAPIVDEAVLSKVELQLDPAKNKCLTKSKENPDFPLRRFVSCGKCHGRLTGSWSTGRNGKRYAYYHCADCGRVRAPKQALEGSFVDLLSTLQPDPEYMRLLGKVVLDAWRTKVSEAENAKAHFGRQIKELRRRKTRLTEAFLYDEAIDRETYDEELVRLNEEIAITRLGETESDLESLDVDGLLQYAEYMVRNVAQLWEDGSHPVKMKLQTLVFPEGLDYGDGGFGNAKVGMFYGGLPDFSEDKSSLVSREGFEPTIHGLEGRGRFLPILASSNL